ncbi:RidA family protein [Neobacillus piezotolerans]|uniref:RidA family protein n=1 Tax=Neobacillus piezotolerans TaxID=2259171 RepID=UPI001FE91280|nr:RidA family protein [Neobacillus piezotolerans]
MEIKKSNPENVAPPIAAYHHVTVIPRDAELVVLSGQIGNDKEGTLPDDIESQFAKTLENIKTILKSEGVELSNVFKINFWLTEKIDREFYLKNGAPSTINRRPPRPSRMYQPWPGQKSRSKLKPGQRNKRIFWMLKASFLLKEKCFVIFFLQHTSPRW